MNPTSKFRAQNDRLLEMVSSISDSLNASTIDEEADRIAQLLVRLGRRIDVHFAQEHRSLFPHYLKSGNRRLQALARSFIDETTGFEATLRDYLRRWASPHSMEADPETFLRETEALLRTLSDRIERENRQLYPALE
jgi:DUF438 domain-containing protein